MDDARNNKPNVAGKIEPTWGGGFQVTDFIHATTAFMAKRVRLLSKLRVADQDCELKI